MFRCFLAKQNTRVHLNAKIYAQVWHLYFATYFWRNALVIITSYPAVPTPHPAKWCLKWNIQSHRTYSTDPLTTSDHYFSLCPAFPQNLLYPYRMSISSIPHTPLTLSPPESRPKTKCLWHGVITSDAWVDFLSEAFIWLFAGTWSASSCCIIDLLTSSRSGGMANATRNSSSRHVCLFSGSLSSSRQLRRLGCRDRCRPSTTAAPWWERQREVTIMMPWMLIIYFDWVIACTHI